MPIRFTATTACYACTRCGQRRPPAERQYDNCLITSNGRHDYKLTFQPLPKSFFLIMLNLVSFKTKKGGRPHGADHDQP